VDNRDVEPHGYKPVGGLFPETSIGWYRKRFTIASADSGSRFQIQFEGIFRNANIWLTVFLSTIICEYKCRCAICVYSLDDYSFHILITQTSLPSAASLFYKVSLPPVQKDAIAILKDHGFNYIRLRIFNDPSRDSGYSPKKGFCDLEHTRQMAKRIKAAGMKFLLDFHYSDYWADPGKQYKPDAWRNLSFVELKKALYDYTKKVIGN
jgi:hypothetical protein